jgi:hypothetical protein
MQSVKISLSCAVPFFYEGYGNGSIVLLRNLRLKAGGEVYSLARPEKIL